MAGNKLEYLAHSLDYPNYEGENLENLLNIMKKNAKTLKVLRLTFTGMTNQCLVKCLRALLSEKDTRLEKVILDYSMSITKNRRVY